MTVNIFLKHNYQDYKQYLRRYQRKPKEMKVHTFTTIFVQLNNHLPYFPPHYMERIVLALPDDKIKEILYNIMTNVWRKKMTKLGYN